MANENRQNAPAGRGSKKWVLIALALTALSVIAFVLIIIFYGMYAADPRGETLPPGP